MNLKIKMGLCLIITGVISANAQLFPSAGDKQVVIGVNGNSAIIQLRKFKTETLNDRYAINLGYFISHNSSGNNGVEYTNNFTSLNGGFSFGKQKNFNVGDKFSPYIALDANVGVQYTPTNSSESTIVDTTAYNLGKSGSQIRQVSSESISKTTTLSLQLGISPVIGFNYYLAKNFALGAECVFNVFSINYTAFRDYTTHSEGSYLKPTANYDNSGQFINYTYTLIDEAPKDTKNSPKPSYSLGGNLNPTFHITASFYFK